MLPPRYLRLPLRMAGKAAQFEFFSKIPSSDAIRDVLRKQLVWHQHLRLQARRRRQPLPPLFPTWIVTPGKPEAYFRRRRVRGAPGFPPGCYRTDEETELWFVVVSELPRTRRTLLLRLFGSDQSRAQALEDIRRMSEHDAELPKLQEFVELLQTAIKRDKTIPADERAHFMTAARAEQIKVHEQLRSEGRREGHARGARRRRARRCA